jgi:hypothetical protein
MQSLPPITGIRTTDDILALPLAQFPPRVIRVVKSSSHRVIESLSGQANGRAHAQ